MEVGTIVVEAYHVDAADDGAPAASGTTGIADGLAYTLTDLAPGDYYVLAGVDVDGDEDLGDGDLYGQYRSVGQMVPVTVTADARTTGVDFALSQVGMLDMGEDGVGGVGRGCATDEECADVDDGICLVEPDWNGVPGGYCSRSCDDGYCPGGGACLDVGGDEEYLWVCLQTCADDAVCRADEGYGCYQTDYGVDLCLHGADEVADAPVGAACEGDAECAPDGVCLLELDGWELWGGYCAIDAQWYDCPEGSTDFEFDDGWYCVKTCADPSECREDDGYTCWDDGSCWPEE